MTSQSQAAVTTRVAESSGTQSAGVGAPLRKSNLRRHINIIRELAVADFRVKYHDSALGYVWSMLNPMFMFAVYYFVFTRIFPSSIGDYPLFLLIGVVSYAFFQDCTFSAMSALANRAGMMKKLYFPRSILVFASSATCIISYFINSTVLLILVFSLKGFTLLALLTPIAVLCLLLFSMGVAFLLATLFAYFRDMSQIWGVLVLALFWLTPIVFNPDALPAPISTYVYFNPLTRIIGLVRHYLLYDYFDPRFLGMTILYSVLSFVVGFWVFRKHEAKLSELLS
jgi:ABC-type polysaccharide/polyol phosphate export permease